MRGHTGAHNTATISLRLSHAPALNRPENNGTVVWVTSALFALG
jgi:hypothetical protein